MNKRYVAKLLAVLGLATMGYAFRPPASGHGAKWKQLLCSQAGCPDETYEICAQIDFSSDLPISPPEGLYTCYEPTGGPPPT